MRIVLAALSSCILLNSDSTNAFAPAAFGGLNIPSSALFSTETDVDKSHKVANKPKNGTNGKKFKKNGSTGKVKISKVDMRSGKNRRRKGKVQNKLDRNKGPLLPITDLKLGATIDGYVAAFTDFGVFIKINYDLNGKRSSGGYALLHKSQIRDETVDDVKKLYRIGAQVKNLRVININYAKGEVGLSLRDQRAKRKDLNQYTIGKEYEGTVSRVVSYGAFVDVGARQNALLHISRISSKKIENVRNFVNEGDKVVVRIISKDQKKGTMAASMLSREADEYIERRSKQLNRMRSRSDAAKEQEEKDKSGLKSEVEYFDEAIRELEASLE